MDQAESTLRGDPEAPAAYQVIVAPVPGTEKGRSATYAPFALDPAPLAFNPSTMAPTGCLMGDFNEDGRLDIAAASYSNSNLTVLFNNNVKLLTEDPAGSGLRSGFGRIGVRGCL